MATTTSILWIPLPAGGAGGAYRVSLYVAPRLEGSGPTGLLQDYDLGNWPQRVEAFVGDLSLELGAPGSLIVQAQVSNAYRNGLDPSLWDRIFPPDKTQVTPRVFQDHSKRWIRSFSIRPLETYLQSLYNGIANASPSTFPDLKGTNDVTRLATAVGSGLGPMREGFPPPQREPGVPKKYRPVPPEDVPATHPEAGLEATLTTIATNLGTPQIPLAEFYRAQRFYRRGNQPPYRSKSLGWDSSLITDPPKEPQFDFHQAVAALGDHPFLLRKLGLIIDLILPVPADQLTKFGQIQVVPPPSLSLAGITPWTKFVVSSLSGFRPEPRKGGDLAEGMLRLDNPDRFDIIQTDPDGNAIKVFEYAASMFTVIADLLAQKVKNPAAKSSQAPEETSVPALRSGGLQVARYKRDDALWAQLKLVKGYEAAPETSILYADDVLRGYRLDANYLGSWHSLCRWQGGYQVAGETIDQPPFDEGYVKADSATSDPDQAPGPPVSDLYVHETLLTWRNWSLVARMPGKTIVPVHQPDKHQKESVEPRQNEPGAGFSVASNFSAEPLSLPPLRYGEIYKLRARTVDLAGNSLAPPPSKQDPNPPGDPVPPGIGESPAIQYLRYDPVPAPVLILTAPVTIGESVDTMVIRNRSTVGLAPGGTPAPLPASLGINEVTLFNPTNARWVSAPKTSVGEAEAHGVFDSLFKTPGAAFDLLKRESGSYDDYKSGETKIVDASGAEVAYPPRPGYVKGDPLPDGMYLIHTEAPVSLPYLPDPLAHGVAFMPKDASNAVHHRAFTSLGWPDAAPFELLLSEAAGAAPSFDVGLNPASVKIPRGTMLPVRYASAIVPPAASSPGELDLMGRWHGMSGGGQTETRTHGYQHWMMTPWRNLTLVHAVERPMAEPKLLKLAASRAPGDTFVALGGGEVAVHAPSTGEIELRGRWTDYVDDPLDTKGPQVLPRDGHIVDRKVDYVENTVHIPAQEQPAPKHEFGDTKHRNVYYRTVGTTRYREYFPANLTGYVDPAPTTKSIAVADPRDPLKQITLDGPPSHARLITVEGPEMTPLSVPSSARPPPPEVLYILPTFKWVDTPNGRQRKGRGLRIYLARGWYASGEGELLGITLTPAVVPSGLAAVVAYEVLRDYVSWWGSDPIFDKNGPTAILAPENFTHDEAIPETAPVLPVGENLLLAERNLRVRVLGFHPVYDDQRKLWHVDLELSPEDAYYTFVRLALCRYQPHSVPDVQISRVVRAEFAQLLADRTATLSHGADKIDINLSGPSALTLLGEHWPPTPPIFHPPTEPSLAHVIAPQPAAPQPVVPAPTEERMALRLPGPGGALPPLGRPPLFTPSPQAGAGHSVVAQIEWRPQGFVGDLAWEPLDGGAHLGPFTSMFIPGIVSWMGSVAWPRPDATKDREYRLVLREYETYKTDTDVEEQKIGPPASPTPVRSRVVYVDIFPLSLP